MLFLTQGNKIYNLLQTILTSMDIENMPLWSQMKFCLNFSSVVFSSLTLLFVFIIIKSTILFVTNINIIVLHPFQVYA